MSRFNKILVATDFGPSSEHALALALALGEHDESEVVMLHVCEVPLFSYGGMLYSLRDVLAPIEEAAQVTLDEWVARAKLQTTNVRGLLRTGKPCDEIQGAIRDVQPDLVVLGRHGRRVLARSLLGSVAEKIVRTSPVPVLTASSPADGELAAAESMATP